MTRYTYYKSTMQEYILSIFENFEYKAVLSAVIAFIGSLMIWDDYLIILWLVVHCCDFCARLAVAYLVPREDFPATRVSHAWLTKTYVCLSIIVLSSIISVVVLRLDATDHIVVNWVIGALIVTDCLIAMESLKYLKVHATDEIINLVTTVKDKMFYQLGKKVESKNRGDKDE